MFEWLCSPHTCYMAGWFYDYQSLIAGVVAAIAAYATVRQIREQVRQSALDTRVQIKADKQNTDRQIEAQRALLDKQHQFERQRERESVATALENEKGDLAPIIWHLEFHIDQLQQLAAAGGVAHDLAIHLTSIKSFAKQTDEQAGNSLKAIRALPFHLTESARNCLSAMFFACHQINEAARDVDPLPDACLLLTKKIQPLGRELANLAKGIEVRDQEQ